MVAGAVNPLYPFTVDVHRSRNPAKDSTVGDGGYQGREATTNPLSPEGEDVLYTGLQVNIVSKGIGRSTGAMTLPGNVTKHPQWRIFTQPLAYGSIRDNDIIIDGEGYRYMVALNQWGITGYTLDCIRMET